MEYDERKINSKVRNEKERKTHIYSGVMRATMKRSMVYTCLILLGSLLCIRLFLHLLYLLLKLDHLLCKVHPVQICHQLHQCERKGTIIALTLITKNNVYDTIISLTVIVKYGIRGCQNMN